MLVDDIDIGVVGENGRDKVAFFEVVVGGRGGRDYGETKKDCKKKAEEKTDFIHMLLLYSCHRRKKNEL